MALISCQNLSVGYENRILFKNLNFSVERGSYLCIIGENGTGKSTLMRTLLGLQQPLEGTILFGDELKENEIGYLPQQTIVQKDFPASVREIVLSGCQNHLGLHPFYGRLEKKRAEEMMEKLQVKDLQNRCYRELSGGQQQRVLLARALCATKKILLLDEPVSGLDPKVTKELYQFIYELNREDNLTIIMITHDMKAAATYATHIMQIGSDLFYGTKQEYERERS